MGQNCRPQSGCAWHARRKKPHMKRMRIEPWRAMKAAHFGGEDSRRHIATRVADIEVE
jgi:hypothetical protein